MSNVAQPQAVPVGAKVVNRTGNTYGQILKSSVLIGGSSAMSMGLMFVRTKVMALLLGPAGVGLMDLFWHIAELTKTVACMGINNSGVRQIAEAVGTNDNERIARTVATLRRVALVLGVVGAVLLITLCKPVSLFVFKDATHAGAVALLSLAVFFGAITAGQTALVQGMRRIADLARMNVLGAMYGTLFSIPIVYFYRERGVVPSLVCVAAMSIVTSWWYSRKIQVQKVSLRAREVMREASGLLKLGVVFMSSVLMTIGAAFLVRVIVKREISSEALGFYQAAWAWSGMYVMFILQAMGQDFYPRLTAAARDNAETNRLVNEQAEISLLLAGPGVLATLAFAPLLIHFSHTVEFAPAVHILRWTCLGMLLRVASWPMGFLLLAKGERGYFFWSELLSNALHVGLVWFLVRQFNVAGAGMAFLAMYVCYWLGMNVIVRRLTGFHWSEPNKRIGLLLMACAVVTFAACLKLPTVWSMALGAVLATGIGIYALKTICKLVPMDRLPKPIRSLAGILRLA